MSLTEDQSDRYRLGNGGMLINVSSCFGIYSTASGAGTASCICPSKIVLMSQVNGELVYLSFVELVVWIELWILSTTLNHFYS